MSVPGARFVGVGDFEASGSLSGIRSKPKTRYRSAVVAAQRDGWRARLPEKVVRNSSIILLDQDNMLQVVTPRQNYS
jgi:hypothetical protein